MNQFQPIQDTFGLLAGAPIRRAARPVKRSL